MARDLDWVVGIAADSPIAKWCASGNYDHANAYRGAAKSSGWKAKYGLRGRISSAWEGERPVMFQSIAVAKSIP